MESMEALKQRLSALKANAAADGGADNIVKVTAAVEGVEGGHHSSMYPPRRSYR